MLSGVALAYLAPGVGATLLQHSVTPSRSLSAAGGGSSLLTPSALLRTSPIRSLHFSHASTPPGTPPRAAAGGAASPAPSLL